MKPGKFLTIISIGVLAAALIPQASGVRAAAYTVTTTADSGVGSLRWAINQANVSPGGDSITFNIPMTEPGCIASSGFCSITLETALPLLTGGDISIDGYSQPGAVRATDSTPAVIKIRLYGDRLGSTACAPLSLCNGFSLVSGGNSIQGLAILQFPNNGIAIGKVGGGPDANGNSITGNYIGVGINGEDDSGNGNSGVFIGFSGSDNIIGGDEPGERNVISGNEWEGVGIHGTDTRGNIVSGNYIGTNAAGTSSVPNTLYGVRIYGGSEGNIIGGASEGEGNLISGNGEGIRLENTTGNLIMGNLIGTNAEGTGAVANLGMGLRLRGGARENIIGGDTASERNLISGNGGPGVTIEGASTTDNILSGNWIGMDSSGTAALWNGPGVLIDGAAGNTIGGYYEGEGNLITGNFSSNVTITGAEATGNLLISNWIGVDISGEDGPGDVDGVLISNGAHGNLVYGKPHENPCILSGNRTGVHITGAGTNGNTVLGCYIGTDTTGVQDAGNMYYGVEIESGAQNNLIEQNLISGNNTAGVRVSSPGTTENRIRGNMIGLNLTGNASLSNNGPGVVLEDGSEGNIVGGEELHGDFNIISGNSYSGVSIVGSHSNSISGNLIGTDPYGNAEIPNGNDGIEVKLGSRGNMIGAGVEVSAPNWISGNYDAGISISGEGTDNNTIMRNVIGLNLDLSAPLENNKGIEIYGGAAGTIVGGLAGEQYNVISGNHNAGLDIYGEGTDDTIITGNFIGTDLASTGVFGNGTHGIAVGDSSTGTRIGPSNVIANNGDSGIRIYGPEVSGVEITRNSTFNNVYGISINAGINGDVAAPVITSAPTGAGSVVGTACPGCRVEVFNSPTDERQGKTYLGAVTADDDGNFSFPIDASPHPYLTATVTDGDSQTSEFSAVYPTVFPLLSAIKTVDRESAYPGEVITYTITLTNSGLANSYEAHLFDYLSEYVTWLDSYTATDGIPFYQAGDHRIQWSPVVYVGSSAELTYAVRVNYDAPAGVAINNTASITYENGGHVSPEAVGVLVLNRPNIYLPLIVR